MFPWGFRRKKKKKQSEWEKIYNSQGAHTCFQKEGEPGDTKASGLESVARGEDRYKEKRQRGMKRWASGCRGQMDEEMLAAYKGHKILGKRRETQTAFLWCFYVMGYVTPSIPHPRDRHFKETNGYDLTL